MLDKIKNALGEELSKQIEPLLQAANLELAVMNDGTVVKAEKYETLKLDHKALNDKYESDVKEFTTKLDAALKGTQDYETLKGTLDKLQVEQQEKEANYKAEMDKIKLVSEYKVKLISENVDPDFVDLLIKDADFSQAKIDNEKVIGIDDILTSQKERYKKAFGEVKRIGGEPEKGLPTPNGKKQQLIEAYNSAEKSGNAKLMMSIQSQLKNFKE